MFVYYRSVTHIGIELDEQVLAMLADPLKAASLIDTVTPYLAVDDGLNSTYLMYVRADSLSNDPRNRRIITATFSRERGAILVGKEPIARSVPTDDKYKFQRTYPQPFKYAPITGYFSFFSQTGVERVRAVADWVNSHMAYISGSSRGTDGAVDSILQAKGVCRDFAHVVVALLRALGTPARLVSVYAPGLQPMDFHAVAEVWVEGAWHIVDATRLAPRAAMVRIATGRDAADTAFLTTRGGLTTFNRQVVTATVDGGRLPQEDPRALVRLA